MCVNVLGSPPELLVNLLHPRNLYTHTHSPIKAYMLERVLLSLCKARERGGVEGILMTNTSQLITTNKTAGFPLHVVVFV